MTPEEGVVGAELVPPHNQLAVSIAEEAANISTCRSAFTHMFTQTAFVKLLLARLKAAEAKLPEQCWLSSERCAPSVLCGLHTCT